MPLLALAGGAGVAAALCGLASDPIVAASLVVLGLLVGAAQQALP